MTPLTRLVRQAHAPGPRRVEASERAADTRAGRPAARRTPALLIAVVGLLAWLAVLRHAVGTPSAPPGSASDRARAAGGDGAVEQTATLADDAAMRPRARSERIAGNDPALIPGAPDPVNAYFSFEAARRGAWSRSTLRDDTAEGMRRLALALDRIAARRHRDRVELQPIVDDLRLRADALRRASAPIEQARYAHEAFATAGGLMQALRNRGYRASQGAVDDARDAALAVSSHDPLATQSEAVERFFAGAARTVRELVEEEDAR